MSDEQRMAALEQRFNEAEAKHVQTMSSLSIVALDVANLKVRVDQITAALTAPMAGQPSPTQEALLKNYEIHSEQITTYLDLLVKASAWYLAVTSGVVTYCLARPDAAIRYALALPFTMGVGLVIISGFGLGRVRYTAAEIQRLATALRLLVFPEARILAYTLRLNLAWLLLVLAGLVWLFFSLPGLAPPLKGLP